MNNYPEHEKLKEVQHESQVQGDFLEWLTEQGFVICKLNQFDDYLPISANTEKLLAGYHGIDLVNLENEKRAMLEEFRKATTP